MKNLESPFITSFSQADNALKIYYGFQYHAEKTTLRQTANTRNVLYKTQILPPRFRIHIPFSQFQQCRSCQRICRFTDCLFQSFVWGTAVHRGHTIIRSCMLRGPPALQQIDRLGHSFARSFCLPATGGGGGAFRVPPARGHSPDTGNPRPGLQSPPGPGAQS